MRRRPCGTRTARSVGCENHSFQLGRNVIGLQFHLEIRPENVANLVDRCRDDATPVPYVQAEREILAAPSSAYDAANRLLDRVFDDLAESIP